MTEKLGGLAFGAPPFFPSIKRYAACGPVNADLDADLVADLDFGRHVTTDPAVVPATARMTCPFRRCCARARRYGCGRL